MRNGKWVRLLASVTGLAPSVVAQTGGTFSATGNMITPRFFHTATMLTDGRVLIAGGDKPERTPGGALPFNTLSNAELYDPRTGAFTATGNMTTPRGLHTATLLPDGRVLIVGGGLSSGNGSLADSTLAGAELYDPSTGTFTATGNMTTPRSGHTATLLLNGKVLIAGGLRRVGDSQSVEFLGSAELYDPSTGTFTATGDMTSEWADTATLLQNGEVLITRDLIDLPPALFYAELYDPFTGTFTGTGNTIIGHNGPTATLLANGKVLVAGGDWGDGDGGSWIAELYDPITHLQDFRKYERGAGTKHSHRPYRWHRSHGGRPQCQLPLCRDLRPRQGNVSQHRKHAQRT